MSPSEQGWGIPCWPQEEGPGELYNSADEKAGHLPGEFNQYDKKLAQGPNPHSWGTRPWALNAAAVGTPESGVGNWRWSTDSSVPSRRWLWLQKRKRNFRVFCTTCVRCTLHIENKLPVLKPCPMLLHVSPACAAHWPLPSYCESVRPAQSSVRRGKGQAAHQNKVTGKACDSIRGIASLDTGKMGEEGNTLNPPAGFKLQYDWQEEKCHMLCSV